MASAAPEPEPKPSLHEIAAMPFPASTEAMRKYYNPEWGRPIPEGLDKKRSFKVRVNYTYRVADDETVTVEAWTEEEAEELAAEEVERKVDMPWNADFEVSDCAAEQVSA